MNIFDDVGTFHRKMGLPVYYPTQPPSWPDRDVFLHRIAHLHEELDELIIAHGRSDMIGAADALTDLIWVACGTAHFLNLPFDALWMEVRRANMEKRPWRAGDIVKPRNIVHIEIVKPSGWVGPDIHKVLYGS